MLSKSARWQQARCRLAALIRSYLSGSQKQPLECNGYINISNEFGSLQLSKALQASSLEIPDSTYHASDTSCTVALLTCLVPTRLQVPVLTGQRPMIVKFRPDAINIRLLRPLSASSSNGSVRFTVVPPKASHNTLL